LAPFVVLAFALAAATSAHAGEVRGFDAPASSYDHNSFIVGFEAGTSAKAGTASIASASTGDVDTAGPRSAVVQVGGSESLKATVKRIARRSGVSFVKPNYTARTSAEWVPDDPGATNVAGNWRKLQWNFVGTYGVNVLPAWERLRELGQDGGKGTVVAIIDTGVAYENYGKFKRSPDLTNVQIRRPYDFLDHDKHANDRNGHGTHVASTVAESTNNGIGVTGIAYGATLMPLRALNSRGVGSEATVARAIRYAANNGAKVINLSVEFDVALNHKDLPVIISAMRAARAKGVLVVAAAGNQSAHQVAYPARSSYALAVGATTYSGCLADYSDEGRGIDLVAPGGGADTGDVDTSLVGSTDQNNCKFNNDAPPIYQITFRGSVSNFYMPGIYEGTSMAAPHVTASAALLVASGLLGPNPSAKAISKRLAVTATDLGVPGYDSRYGAGIVNVGNALTAP
jgi:serine protease